MLRKSFTVLICILMIGLICIGSAFADSAEDSKKARDVAAKYGEAVVSVIMVFEQSMSYDGGNDKRQIKSDTTGCVIDPSGLIVTALSEIDPMSQLPSMDESDFKFTSKVVDAKIKLSDGTELPVDVVLRDKDLDLAYLRLKKAPASPLAFVDMTTPGAPDAFDTLVVLGRLGQVAGRSLAVNGDGVRAVITKPRKFYVVYGSGGRGCPAFDLNGNPVGIVVLRTGSKGKSASNPYDYMSDALAAVMPCSTIMSAAEQAKTAVVKPEVEQKTETNPVKKPDTKPAKK